MRAILAADRGLNNLERWVGGTLLLSIAGILFVNVVARFLFSSSFIWAEELSRYFAVWLTFVGASILVREGGHISVDLLRRALPPGWARWLVLVISAVGLVTMVYLFILGWELAWSTYQSGQIAPTMPIRVGFLYFAVPVGAFLMGRNFFRVAILALQGRLVDQQIQNPEEVERIA